MTEAEMRSVTSKNVKIKTTDTVIRGIVHLKTYPTDTPTEFFVDNDEQFIVVEEATVGTTPIGRIVVNVGHIIWAHFVEDDS